VTDTAKRYELDQADVDRAWASYVAASAREGPERYQAKLEKILQLLACVGPAGPPAARRLVIDQPTVLRWLVRTANGTTVLHAAQRLALAGRFLKALTQAGLVDTDLMAEYRTGLGKPSWRRLAEALQSADPEKALTALRPALPPPGPLAVHIHPYIALHQSLGKQYARHWQVLRDLDQFLQAQAVPSPLEVTPALVERWMAPMTGSKAVRLYKARYAEAFFDHLCGLGLVTNNPVSPSVQSIGRQPSTSAKPFIFTQEQITAILAEAGRLPDTRRFRHRAPTCSTMLTLLYALGLRLGEVCRLRLRDLDFTRRALFIDQTKFHKSRYVPFGPKVEECLQRFLAKRRLVLLPLRDDDPLFVTCRRQRIPNNLLFLVFRDILRARNVLTPLGRTPRLHDLRHTFAAHRLLRWYRDGVDIQARLPLLSTFLGHVEMRSTEVYLTVTQELLQEANKRYHQHFGRLFDEDGDK
jgi:site-specific recombinase XerD